MVGQKLQQQTMQNGSSAASDAQEVSSERSFDAGSDGPPRLEPNSKTRVGIVVPHTARAPDGRTVIVRPSTAVFPNRVRDKIRIEAQLRLPETGDPRTEFYSRSGNTLFAVGYERIVYGDHGPYIEFGEKNIRWHAFPVFRPKPEWSFFDEWYTIDGALMLYAQKRMVSDKPNPPAGQWAYNNNRPEGYADYRIGKYYVPCEVDEIAAILRSNSQPSSWRGNSRLNYSAMNGRSSNDYGAEKADGYGGLRSDVNLKKGRGRWNDKSSSGASSGGDASYASRVGYQHKTSGSGNFGNGKGASKGKNGSSN